MLLHREAIKAALGEGIKAIFDISLKEVNFKLWAVTLVVENKFMECMQYFRELNQIE